MNFIVGLTTVTAIKSSLTISNALTTVIIDLQSADWDTLHLKLASQTTMGFNYYFLDSTSDIITD